MYNKQMQKNCRDDGGYDHDDGYDDDVCLN